MDNMGIINWRKDAAPSTDQPLSAHQCFLFLRPVPTSWSLSLFCNSKLPSTHKNINKHDSVHSLNYPRMGKIMLNLELWGSNSFHIHGIWTDTKKIQLLLLVFFFQIPMHVTKAMHKNKTGKKPKIKDFRRRLYMYM